MVVQEPQENDVLTSPAHVRGWGAGIGFEDAGVRVAIYDASAGEPLTEVTAGPLPREGRIPPPTLQAGEFAAPFGVDIAFRISVPKPGCVRVFEVSAAEGKPIHVVQIPVLLQR
jgi:hypothetical protein